MAVTSSLVARSFITNPETPDRINLAASSASVCSVKTITLASRPAAFSCSNASMPLNPGIEMSVTTTSGRNRVAASTRRLPLATAATTSNLSFNMLTIPSSTNG
jgi:hypothetical protein